MSDPADFFAPICAHTCEVLLSKSYCTRRLKAASQGFDGHTSKFVLWPYCPIILGLSAIITNTP